MKIYALSGLGADERVYAYLNISCEIIVLKWIKPLPGESLKAYAKRLSKGINTDEQFGIIGLSFGGLVAVEISKELNPLFTILISTAEIKNEIPWFYRVFGAIGILKILPIFLFNIPAWIVIPLFKTKHKDLVKNILHDTDPVFVKWALIELINWKNAAKLSNRLKISGTEDCLFPPKLKSETVLVHGGGHFMIVDKADEINRIIVNWLTSGLEQQD
jgi:pimeloyl-ACP methyl ester carboxylesterase